jgi:ketosteroid isomerase-like protein
VKIRLATAFLLVLAPTLAVAQPSPGDTARAALLKADAEWAALASTAKDVEQILAVWTDDAVIVPPREPPVRGKAAIRAYVGESLKLPGFSINWTPESAVVSASGDLGYTMGTNRFTVPDGKGATITLHGRYVTIWRRQADGTWRCVVDFWNEAPPAPGPK